jgi:predicted nucleic acid-binding protein
MGRALLAPDVMVAATAIGAGLPVVTGNTAHFAAVQRVGYPVATENWQHAMVRGSCACLSSVGPAR